MKTSNWDIDDVHIGDYIRVEIRNPHGDRNLDGVQRFGEVVAFLNGRCGVRLDSGWCCHTKDVMLEHRKGGLELN